MMYQLQTGKTIMIDIVTFLEMKDSDFQDLVADDRGIEINNPFFNKSSGRRKTFQSESDSSGEDLLDARVDYLEDIPDISDVEEVELDEDITDY